MDQLLDLAWLIVAFPLVGFGTILLFGRRLGEPAAGWLATAAMAGSFVASVLVFVGLRDRPEGDRRFVQTSV